jgi:2-amino-4-hydroxy-6-hydroxymethyldihydropteridine diphosphokinase
MILVAVGGNLPTSRGVPPRQTCEAAVVALGRIGGLRLAAVSSWYETMPEPPSSQPLYVNGVARLEGETEPVALLRRLQALEAAGERDRGARNAARTLDLDIIDLNGLVRPAPDPILPHPRAHLRSFVLIPLRDVAPDWVHPVLGHTVDALIAELSPRPSMRRL